MRKIFVFFGIVAVGAFLWWVFSSPAVYSILGISGFSKSGPNSSGTISDLAGATKRTLSQAEKNLTTQSGQMTQAALSSSQAVVKGTEATIADRVQSFIPTVFNNFVEAGRNYLGITSTAVSPSLDVNATVPIGLYDANGNVFSIFLGSVVKVNQPVGFVVGDELFQKNNVSEVEVYVNWKDGARESQVMDMGGQNNSLTHTFHQSGTYKPLFTFEAGSSTIQYELTIIVKD